MKKRIIYYSDELNDDFSTPDINTKPLGEDFRFIRGSLIWRACSFLLYYIAAIPLVFIINKAVYGLKINNRKALKKVSGGFFLYGNHTQYFTDATCQALLCFPKRAYIIAGADAFSIKGLRCIVQLLGAIALPDTIKGMKGFVRAINKRIDQNAAVAIYPEAHIWPYYTGIRPFGAASFQYPAKKGVPVFAYTITYRKRLIKLLPPAITIYVSDPIYPDMSKSLKERKTELRNKAYDFMCSMAEKNQLEHIRYIKVRDKD